MEYFDFDSIPIAQLPSVDTNGAEILFVSAEVVQAGVPYPIDYTFTFPDLPLRKPGIVIQTPERNEYLKHATEAQAQQSLVALAKATQDLTAGVFNIHPFYGAIVGTKKTPVAPEFGNGTSDLTSPLSANIILTANGGVFSDTLSEEASTIPLSFELGTRNADRYFAFRTMANTGNPNQSNKDQATSNGLAERWTREFNEFNPVETMTCEPMKMELGSIALLLQLMTDRKIIQADFAALRILVR